MKIIYVPAAIRAALEAAGLGGKDLLSVEKLASILSPEDVAFYCYVNMHLSSVMPPEIAQSLGSAFCNQAEMALPSDGDKNVKEAMRVLNEYCLNDSAPVVNTTGQGLTCDVMDENIIRFTHTPVAADELSDSSVQGRRDLFDRVIHQLLVFIPFETLAQLPLLTGYLKSSQACMAADATA